ncbi:MAG TPA: hypothetical protein VMO26_10645 [Vicinamibacterales bacterium]|nr:hypothetical protein [Vicinamibacterales bacterium]
MKAGHDRDRTLDEALKQALGARADVPPSDACLDAETLAAWMDEGLDPGAVALAEAHVSSCARCQALVGTMARTASEVPVSGRARSSFWRWWLAPIAAASAAATLWMVVPDERYTAPPPPAHVGEPAQAPSPNLFVPEPQTPASPSAPPPPAVSPRPSEVAPRSGAPAGVSPANESSTRVGKTASTETAARSRTQSADAREERAAQAESMALRAELPAAREIVSPDPAVRWRIGVSGAVDYTADGGRTWERVSTGVTTEIAAGSAPSRDVCWLVGHGGLVLVSSDGRTFVRIPAPVHVDLAGVQASDARTAVVTAADGRVFQTDDGGLTWRPRE